MGAIAQTRGRKDECEAPPNFKELADKTGFGLNVNGSVCLHNVCTYVSLSLSFSRMRLHLPHHVLSRPCRCVGGQTSLSDVPVSCKIPRTRPMGPADNLCT